MNKPKIIQTVYPYYKDIKGYWWTVNPQQGWVPVPSNGRALVATLEAAGIPRV